MMKGARLKEIGHNVTELHRSRQHVSIWGNGVYHASLERLAHAAERIQ